MDEARLTLGSWRHIGDLQDLMQHSFWGMADPRRSRHPVVTEMRRQGKSGFHEGTRS